MKTLKDLRLVPGDEKKLEGAIQEQFNRVIYRRIMEIVKKYRSINFRAEIKNSKGIKSNSISDLVKAIVDGEIQYIDGRFEGKFTASTSRELKRIGANWDPRLKAWHLSQQDMPMDVSLAVGTMVSAYNSLHREIRESLKIDSALKELESERMKPIFESTLAEYEKQYQKAVKGVGVEVKLSQGMRDNITEQYTKNMEKYIKGWTEENILKLREEVERNLNAGGRAENLEKILNRNYGASINKAKFLARQESALLLASYRKERFKDAGVQRYRWRTSQDERVRERHRELDGKIFFWDEAIIDDKGTRGNPKEAFGCRCTAEPILED